jgi:hypothetical protein
MSFNLNFNFHLKGIKMNVLNNAIDFNFFSWLNNAYIYVCGNVHIMNLIKYSLLARCGQVHLVFHSELSELGQINYRPIIVKQLDYRLIPQ